MNKEFLDELFDIADRIYDPMEEVLKKWEKEGILQSDEIARLKEEAFKTSQKIAWEVEDSPGPTIDQVGKHTRIPHPEIVIKGFKQQQVEMPFIEIEQSDEILTKNGAQAQSEKILEVMKENPGLMLGGIDINLGIEVQQDKTGKYNLVYKGSYRHETDNIHHEMGHLPGRVWNFPIGENAIVQLCAGMVTQPSSNVRSDFEIQKAILDGQKIEQFDPRTMLRRAILDLQYQSYTVQAFEAWWVHGQTVGTTSGKYCEPFGVIAPGGISKGGGAMHSYNIEAVIYQLAEGMSVYTVSTPEMIDKLLNYTLRFENNPYVILVDQAVCLDKPETWRKGTGLHQPGRDRIIQDGSDLQIITWGPMRSVVEKAAKIVTERFENRFSIGILEKISWRPWNNQDLATFLEKGRGPILIATEEFKSKSLANQLKVRLDEEAELKTQVKDRGREVLPILGTKDVSHPYCDELLISAIRYEAKKLVEEFSNALMKKADKK